MTEQEVIEWEYCRAIDLIKKIKTEETHERYVDRHKALDMAISALEGIQQYRALGTVEQLMDMKKNYVEALSDWRQYRKIGTLEELREVREKQVSKKPIRNDLCTCPSCGTHNEVIKKRRNTVNNDIVYCWHCGQAMEVNRLE